MTEFASSSEPGVREIVVALDQYLSSWQERVTSGTAASVTPVISPLGEALDQLAVQAVERAHVEIVKLAKEAVPRARRCRVGSGFFERIQLLEQYLPPSRPGENAASFAEIAAAAWAYEILYGEQREHAEQELDKQRDEYMRICRLTLKAIELIPTGGGDPLPAPSSSDVDNSLLSKAGSLSGPDIVARLQLPLGHRQRLAIIPFTKKAVQGASLDVHLGSFFVTARRTRLSSVKLGERAGERLLMSIGREEAFISGDQTFLLHPDDLLLGATLEFIALPPDVVAFVEGKSRLARLGLLVATATAIAPGFHGVVVLELANTGTVPLELVPGMPIAQLVPQVMTNPVPEELLYRGPSYCQIRP